MAGVGHTLLNPPQEVRQAEFNRASTDLLFGRLGRTKTVIATRKYHHRRLKGMRMKSILYLNSKYSLITLLILSVLLPSCLEKTYRSVDDLPRNAELTLPSGKKLKMDLALTKREKQKGVSGIQAKDFPDDRGLLFVYWNDEFRRFWMPDTHFDLDIFFLDKDLKIRDVERNVPHYPGWQNPSKIPQTRTILSAHVLEMKSASPLAKEIKPGDSLKWSSKPEFNIYRKVMKAAGL